MNRYFAVVFINILAAMSAQYPADASPKPNPTDCQEAHCRPGQVVVGVGWRYLCATKRELDDYFYYKQVETNELLNYYTTNDSKAKTKANAATTAMKKLNRSGECTTAAKQRFVVVLVDGRDGSEGSGHYMEVSPDTDHSKTYWTNTNYVAPVKEMGSE